MDRMTSLEKRVDQLLVLMKGLKEDRARFKKEVLSLEKELSKRNREANRWIQDRERLRSRVEQILSETGNVLVASRGEARKNQPQMVGGDGWKPRRRGWGAGKGGDA